MCLVGSNCNSSYWPTKSFQCPFTECFILVGAMWAPLYLVLLLWTTTMNCGVINVLLESVVGTPTLHEKTNWKFDPDEATRLNEDFEAEHGHHSAILIEKLGLGVDGNRKQRLQQQRLRDQYVPITGYNSPTKIYAKRK